MKRTFKMKALVVSMIVMMVFNFIPNLYAAKYENSVEESAADIVCSLTADKTEVVPGDVVTVSFSVTKMPDNGLGIRAFSARMVYDSSKLELNTYYDEDYEDNYVDIQAGKVGKKLGFIPGAASVAAEPGVENRNRISMGLAVASENSAKNAGDVVVMKFTVKEGATGPIEFYLKSDSVEDDGFAVAGNKYDGENLVVDGDMTYYVSTNLDDLKVLTPANSVAFEGIDKVELDTVTNTTANVASYVVIDPTDTTDTMSWSSENPAVATVDANGNITAVGKGTTNIIVTVGTKSASLPVTVKVLLTNLEFENLSEVNLDATNNPTADISGYVKLTPADADIESYEWSSDNPAAATVDANGVVTALSRGTAIITVKVNGYEATVPVNVKVSASGVEFENLNKVVLDTLNNTTADISGNVKVIPFDADVESYEWSSDNNAVVTVDQNGVLTAVGKGTANVSVKVNGHTATVPVVVTVPVSGVEFENLSEVNLDVTNNPTADISGNVKLTPADADVEACQWSSDNTSVVTVDQNGVLTAVGKGTANVSVNVDGCEASVTVNVKVSATAVAFENLDEVLLDTTKKQSQDISGYVVLTPADADVESYEWSSDNTAVATVDEYGVVTAVAKGNANITVKVNGHTATVPVTVMVSATGVSIENLTGVELDLTTNPTADITANIKVTPADADIRSCEWSSDNTAVATFKDGVITAVGKGTANVTVKVDGYEATIPVVVTASVKDAKFNIDNFTLDVKDVTTKDLSDALVLDPADADVKSIAWSSSDENVATVDQNGVVTAVGKGTATITANVDGKLATVTVNVEVKLESISLDKTEVTVYKNDKVTVQVKADQEGSVIDTLNGSFQSGNEYAMFNVVGDTVEITGVAEGTAVINVSANKGTTPELNKQITVIVKENPITSVSVTAENDEAVLRGATKTLTASYETKESEDIHKTTDDTTVTWTSSDETIATVKDGVVTALKEGTVTITATIAGKSDTYEVTVKEIHVDGIVIDEETAIKLDELENVTVGDKVEIPFTVTPENYTDTVEEILAFVNTAFDEELVDVVVTYDEATKAGKITITAKKAGNAEIYVMAGEPESEEDEVEAWKIWFEIVEPVVEEEEAPATGDMPIVMLAIVMAISVAGIVVSKKVLVK